MRVLRRFEEKKLIQRHRGKIVINSLDGLKARLGTDANRL